MINIVVIMSAVITSLMMNSSEVVTCNNSDSQNITNDLKDNNTCTASSSLTARYPSGIAIAFLSMDVVIVVSSLVLTVLIHKATKLKEAPGHLLMHNAVCDGIVSLSWHVLFIVRMTLSSTASQQTAIYIQRIIVYIIANVSFDTLLVTLFTLHLAICSPFRYKLYCRKLYLFISILVSWILNTAIASSVLLVEGYEVVKENAMVILLNAKDHYPVFVTIELLRGLLLPLITLLVCYIRISLHVRSSENSEIFRQSTNTTYIIQAKGILLVTITFLLSHQPVYLLEVLKATSSDSGTDEQLLYYIKMGFSYMAYLYYLFKLPLFLVGFQSLRRAFVTIFCSCCCDQSRSSITLYSGAKRTPGDSAVPCGQATPSSLASNDLGTGTTSRASSAITSMMSKEGQPSIACVYSVALTDTVSMKID